MEKCKDVSLHEQVSYAHIDLGEKSLSVFFSDKTSIHLKFERNSSTPSDIFLRSGMVSRVEVDKD